MKAEDLISMVLILGVLPITVIILLFLLQKAKHKERIELIDKGVDISSLPKKDSPFNNILMWGMILVGVGLGLLPGYLLIEYGIFKDDAIMGILAILFGGIGLIGYYFINRKDGKK